MTETIPQTGNSKTKSRLNAKEIKALKAMTMQKVECFNVEELTRMAKAAGIHQNTLRALIEKGEGRNKTVEQIREKLLVGVC